MTNDKCPMTKEFPKSKSESQTLEDGSFIKPFAPALADNQAQGFGRGDVRCLSVPLGLGSWDFFEPWSFGIGHFLRIVIRASFDIRHSDFFICFGYGFFSR